MRKIQVTIIILLMCLLIGCSTQQQYHYQIIKLAIKNNYAINYNVSLNTDNFALSDFAYFTHFSVRKANNVKVASITYFGYNENNTYSYYEERGTKYACLDRRLITSEYNTYECDNEYRNNDFSLDQNERFSKIFFTSIDELWKKSQINYIGQRLIREKVCDNYEIWFNESNKVEKIFSADIYEFEAIDPDGKLRDLRKIEVCFDKKTALPLILNLYSHASYQDAILDKVLGFEYLDNKEDLNKDKPRYSIKSVYCDSEKYIVYVEPYSSFTSNITMRKLGKEIDYVAQVLNEFNKSNERFEKNKLKKIQFPNNTTKQLVYDLCIGDYCMWDVCFNSPPDFQCGDKTDNKKLCEETPNCIFSAGICTEFDCDSIFNKNQCENYPSCYWYKHGPSWFCRKVIVPAPIKAKPMNVFEIAVKEEELVDLNKFEIIKNVNNVVFTGPFNKDGKWQTKAGDAGSYSFLFSAFNGSNNLTLTFNVKVNNPPEIISEDYYRVKEGDLIYLKIDAKDKNGDEIVLTYSGWMNSKSYQTNYNDSGVHVVNVQLCDAWHCINKDIKIIVSDVK